MSVRTGYKHGDPSWVDHSSPDPAAAASFYSELFGWETEDQMPPEADGEHHMAQVNGKAVAALSTQQADGAPSVWNTYVTVDSVDETAEAVAANGGTVVMEPFDVFGAGRMAVCTDPAGTFFMIWEARESIGAERVGEHGAMGWNELMTRDVDGSKEFYGSIFGWTTSSLDFEGGTYILWHHPDDESEGIAGMMEMAGDEWPADMPPHWMVYFAVDDTDATASKAEELGGAISVPPFDIEGTGRMAVLNDPQGGVFSVIRPVPQS